MIKPRKRMYVRRETVFNLKSKPLLAVKDDLLFKTDNADNSKSEDVKYVCVAARTSVACITTDCVKEPCKKSSERSVLDAILTDSDSDSESSSCKILGNPPNGTSLRPNSPEVRSGEDSVNHKGKAFHAYGKPDLTELKCEKETALTKANVRSKFQSSNKSRSGHSVGKRCISKKQCSVSKPFDINITKHNYRHDRCTPADAVSSYGTCATDRCGLLDPASKNVHQLYTSSSQRESSLMECGDIKELHRLIPGRETQIDILTSLLNKNGHTLYPAVFLFGNAATGKSLVAQKVLNFMKMPAVYVNCAQCYSISVLCENIIYQISGLSSRECNTLKCENLSRFVLLLQQLINKGDSVCFVIDKAEKLSAFEGVVLFTLLKLQELCQRNICVLFVSEIEWSHFIDKMGSVQPIMIYFPNYNKVETLKILSLDCPSDCSSILHHKFLDHLWEVFSTICRSLSELRYLSVTLFPIYLEPISKGEIQPNDNRKLWNHINPFFKQAMNTLYQHSTSRSPDNEVDYTEIPYNIKFLLIASFLASYNSARTDKKYFSEYKETKKKRRTKSGIGTKASTQLVGPNNFPLNRLLKIFQSITESQIMLTVNLLSQIRSLISLRYLSCVSKAEQLEHCRYKCMVSLDCMLAICRTVQFNLSHYLQ